MSRILLCLIAICFAFPALAQNAREMAAAKQILSDLQATSFKNNREYCGVLLRRPDGTLISSKAYRGTKARCRVKRIPQGATVAASYHTHGAYLPGYDNEVPSLLDLEVEMDWGIDGYVSTPGGRFWHVDGRNGTVRLVCGLRCLPSDPRFKDQSRVFGKIRTNYNFETLMQRSFFGSQDQ